jgi:hypothetical protein
MQDHLSHPDTAPVRQSPRDPADIHSLVNSAMRLANAMQDRLMDGEGNLKTDIPIREGKEAVASISTLLGMILRNKSALENRQYQQQFDASVLQVLEEMDEENRTTFFARLQEKLSHIDGAA